MSHRGLRRGPRNATELLDDLCELSVARTVARLVSGAAYGDGPRNGAELPEAEAAAIKVISSNDRIIIVIIYIYVCVYMYVYYM